MMIPLTLFYMAPSDHKVTSAAYSQRLLYSAAGMSYKHEMFIQCWIIVGPASQTAGQH